MTAFQAPDQGDDPATVVPGEAIPPPMYAAALAQEAADNAAEAGGTKVVVRPANPTLGGEAFISGPPIT